MHISIFVLPVIALACGIIILIRPEVLPIVVACYLIVVGILGMIARHG